MGGVRATYSFNADWTVPAPMAAVAETVLDLEHYPEWWPQVRAVASLGPTTARVICRSALPYDLDLVLESVSQQPPLLEVAVAGDLDGWVRWHLEEYAGGTRMRFEQQVGVGGLLALASYVARPLLTWNHHRMMRGCEAGLRDRLRSAARPG
ncbi:MAG TPA: SRPBCC family protein [Nocardioides sp.]|nr:SRPBCC family protein [Nocardioides sp.]